MANYYIIAGVCPISSLLWCLRDTCQLDLLNSAAYVGAVYKMINTCRRSGFRQKVETHTTDVQELQDVCIKPHKESG